MSSLNVGTTKTDPTETDQSLSNEHGKQKPKQTVQKHDLSPNVSTISDKSAVATAGNIAQTLGLDQTHVWRGYVLKWAGIAVVIVVLAAIVLRLFGNGNSQTVRYKTAEVTRGNLTVTVTATGTLEPVNQVEVGSEISGTIRAVLVDFNDRVEQGQVLASVDTDQLQAQVNQAVASLGLAKAQVKQAEATVIETTNSLNRADRLVKSNAFSQEEYDAAQAAHERAVANLAGAKAQVSLAQASLDAQNITLGKATVLSPITGIVLNRDVEPGQTVAASFQTPVLFTLAENLTQMELHVDVDEADVGLVQEGQDAEFSVDAYANKTFPAKIIEVHFASQTIDGVVTYETVLSVDNSDLLLRPGMTATADITVKQIEDALLLPNAALRFSPPAQQEEIESDGGSLISKLMPRPPRSSSKQNETTKADSTQQQVWVLRDDQAMAIDVVTDSSDGIMTEITGGDLQPGMALIVDSFSGDQ